MKRQQFITDPSDDSIKLEKLRRLLNVITTKVVNLT